MASASTVLNGNKLVTVTAKLQSFTITVGDSGTGQTLQVSVNGGSTWLSSGQSASVAYGTAWTARLTPATGYTAGTIYPASSGTIKQNTSVTCSAATILRYSVTLGARGSSDVTISGNGSTVTNTSLNSIPYGTSVTVTATPWDGYKVDSINVA